MSPRQFAFLFLVMFSTSAPAQEVDPGKLRELLVLPKVHANFGLHLSLDYGFRVAGGGDVVHRLSPALEIAGLEHDLCGDAGDARRYCRLSYLYPDENRAKEAAEMALELARAQQQLEPGRARTARQLADALYAVGKIREAADFYALAGELDPHDAGCFLDLAYCYHCEAAETLRPEAKGQANAEIVAGNRALMLKAIDYCSKAIAAEPKYAWAYERRALHRALYNIALRGGAVTAQDTLACTAAPEVVEDLCKAAELAPRDARLQTVTAFLALGSGSDQAAGIQEKTTEQQGGADLSRAVKILGIFGQAVARLRELGNDANRQNAADAHFGNALLYAVAYSAMNSGEGQDFDAPATKEIESWLRRAVELNPLLEPAWFLLSMITKDETIHSDSTSAWYRCRLAYLRAHAGRLDEAEQHLRAALKNHPQDVSCKLGLAALLMKRGNQSDLPEADRLLAQVEALNKEEHRADVALLRVFYSALAGQLETARTLLKGLTATQGEDDVVTLLRRLLEK